MKTFVQNSLISADSINFLYASLPRMFYKKNSLFIQPTSVFPSFLLHGIVSPLSPPAKNYVGYI